MIRFLPSSRFRTLPSVATAAALAASLALPLAAQQPPRPAGAEQWVAEAEHQQERNPPAAYALVQRRLGELGPAEQALRMRALTARCWAATDAAEDSVLAHAAQGMAEAARAGDRKHHAELRACRGLGLTNAGELQPSIAQLDTAMAEARALGDRGVLGHAQVLRGEASYYRGDFDHALADFGAAYRLLEAAADTQRLHYTLTAIANLYADSRVAQYDRALEYYHKLLQAYLAGGEEREVANTHFNLGSTLEQVGRLNEALAEYRRGLEMDMRRAEPGEVAVDRRSVGIVLYKLGRPAEALAVLELALGYFERSHDEEMVAETRLSRGVALRMLGRPAEALADLEVARARFERTGSQRFLVKAQEERALAFAAAGDWSNAYQARTAQLALQNALGEQARAEQTSRLRMVFDVTRKEQENAALVRENGLRRQAQAAGERIRRLQIAVLLLGAVVIAALAMLVLRQIRGARLLRSIAMTDELTGLANRRHLLAVGEEHARAALSGEAPYAVLALDVDRFKEINDRWGHEGGDEVLRGVAEAMRSSLRALDRVGRTGGEEFVAVLPGASLAASLEVAERLRGAVERIEFPQREGLRVTVSVGVAVWERGDTSFAATARRADASLYRAKEAGRNRVEADGGADLGVAP